MGKTSLAPGFRFHPTDVELVRYYLKRKVLGKRFKTNPIAEIDIYKFEPPDLPDKSCLTTGDLKWYFFCPREKKYPKSAKAKRSTESGHWKTSGKDRDVSYNNEVVGKIRTLIFHYGKTPRGERTDWVMHEYRLEDEALAQKNVPQDAYVLCVLFKKNGLGPRHGSEYGAPFKEEDWSDEEEEEEEDTQNLVAIESAEHVDPSRETNLVATASHSQAPKDCVAGVISESCVSGVPVLPPLTSDVVAHTPLLEVPQGPPDDDGLYSMLDLFAVDNDDTLLFDGFNQQYEARHEHGVPVVEEAPVCLGDDDFSGIPDMSDDLYIELEDLIGPSSPPQAGNSSSNGQT
uniref:NAC domain-containing protein 78 n=1 Tax=Noccaea caerulescens TaxID=107243 RepID=A0A1J3IE26_NOCCA